MIVPLMKVTAYGLVEDKAQILGGLQEIGCLHLIPLKPVEDPQGEGGPSSEARDALKFLLGCRQRRRQVRDPSKFDATTVQHQALDLMGRIQTLADERDFLRHRIMDLTAWGEFSFPPLEDLKNLRLWFYAIPHNEMKKMESTDLTWEVVRRDNRFSYVVVISEDEPKGMPVPRTHTGSKPLSELMLRLEEVELELEDLQAERASLTRWCYLFARDLHRLEDQAALGEATQKTYDDNPIFALQAWAPRENVEELRTYARDRGLALDVVEPEPGETPPTLLRNPPNLAGGQALVSFYTTPGYWVWDPSTIVFFSFAAFFAMILADAGYGLILGLGLLLGWRRMGRSDSGRRLRILFATLIGATVVYGALVGSYFGIAPVKGALVSRLKILDLNNFTVMMRLSVLIGVIHLTMANIADAWRGRRSAQAVASVGWVFIFLGGFSAWMGSSSVGPAEVLTTAGIWAMGLGLVAVLLFTRVEGSIGKRLLGGLEGLTRISSAFGDTLSYLRLFALGLASASLAIAFNGLAKQVYSAVPGFGILFALLIVLIGHTLNFMLAIVNGLIHGLRLNFIEFFKWSVTEEGYPFRPFARKESSSWSKSFSH